MMQDTCTQCSNSFQIMLWRYPFCDTQCSNSWQILWIYPFCDTWCKIHNVVTVYTYIMKVSSCDTWCKIHNVVTVYTDIMKVPILWYMM